MIKRLVLAGLILVFIVFGKEEKKDSSLIGYWKFDEAQGTTVRDSSGNENNGGKGGTTWVTGKSGSGLYFDGIDDAVRISNKKILNPKEFTISAWIYPETISGERAIFSKGSSGLKGAGINFLVSGGRLKVYIFDSTGVRKAGASDKVIVPQKWQHVTFSFNGETGYFYCNGKKCGQLKCSGFTPCSRYISIGKWCYGNAWQFQGVIDEVKFYNRALTSEEIAAQYNKEKAPSQQPTSIVSISTTGTTEESIPLEDWAVKRLSKTIEASQFRLQVGAELVEDETAWDGLAVTPGGGEHCNLYCTWRHLDFKPDLDYNLFIHFKSEKDGITGGGALSPWKHSFSFKGKKGMWQTVKIGPFKPKQESRLILYGSPEVIIDRIYFAPVGVEPTEPDPDWYSSFKDEGWERIKLPLSWKQQTNFGRCGIVLLKKKVSIPTTYEKKDGFFIFRTGEVVQRTKVYFNGQVLVQVNKNSYGIPNSFVKYGEENLLCLKITSQSSKGCIIKGPVKLFFVHSPHPPIWTKNSQVIKKSSGKIQVWALIQKKSIKRGELCQVDFVVLENGMINPCFPVRVFLNDQSFPVVGDIKTGDYTTWVSSLEPGIHQLKIELNTGENILSFSLGKITVKENTLQKKNLKDIFPIGTWITPLSFETGEEMEKHYNKLFQKLKEYGINTVVIAHFSGKNLDVIKKLTKKYGLSILFYPTVFKNIGVPLNPKKVYSACKKTADDWKSCPNLIAYGIWDEISLEQAKHWKFIRMVMEGLDPEHPVTVCLNQNHLRQTEIQEAQILHRDIYYPPGGSSKSISGFEKEVINAGRISEKLKIPLWVTMAPGYPVNGVREMCWHSLSNGATGLFFFHCYTIYPKGSIWRGFIELPDLKPTPQLEVIKEISQKINKHLSFLSMLKSSENIAKSSQPLLSVKTRSDHRGNFYLFIVNRDINSEVTGDITINKEIGKVIDIFTGEEINLKNRVFSCNLKPGDGKVYRLVNLH